MALYTRILALALIIFGCLAGASNAAPSAPPAEPDLLKIAIRVVQDNSKYSGVYDIQQSWLSDEKVIYLKNETIWMYDLAKKTDTPLSRLTEEIRSGVGYTVIKASPGIGYIAWSDSASEWHTATSTGDNLRIWPISPQSQLFWCADGVHFVAASISMPNLYQIRLTQSTVYNLLKPNEKPVHHAMPAGLRNLNIITAPSPDVLIARNRASDMIDYLSKTIKPGQPITFRYTVNDNPTTVSRISVWDLGVGHKNITWSVSLRYPTDEVAASRDGNRLAWLISPVNPQTGLLPVSLWVSNLNGSNLRELGVVDQVGSALPGIYDIEWLPSGKAISFRYNGWLYEVPAP